MVSIWIYLFLIGCSFIVSFVAFASLFIIVTFAKDLVLEKILNRIPTDNSPDYKLFGKSGKLANPGKPIHIDKKEVEQNELTQFNRIREFDRLRREGQKNKRTGSGKPDIQRLDELQGRGNIPIELNEPYTGNEQQVRYDDTSLGQDRKKLKLSRPTDI